MNTAALVEDPCVSVNFTTTTQTWWTDTTCHGSRLRQGGLSRLKKISYRMIHNFPCIESKDRTVDNILCLPWTESPCISKPSVSRISGTFYLALNIPAYGRGEGCAWTCGSLLLRRRSWWIIVYLTWKVLMRWWKQRRETCWRWTRARNANLVTCKQVKVGFENRKELGIRSEILWLFSRSARSRG